VFIVKFKDLVTVTATEATYEHLFSALDAIKNSLVGPTGSHITAMNHNQFDSQLLTLLTTGMAYGGMRSDKFPDGEVMISLYRLEGGQETVVYNALPMPAYKVDSEGEVRANAPLPRRQKVTVVKALYETNN
jgi:hypothetical protein